MTLLKKGDSLKFLSFTILYCKNDDGLVLLSSEDEHCGNFGHEDTGIDNAKQAAILYYMMSRPEVFKTCLLHKVMRGTGSGTSMEWYLLRDSLKADKLTMPTEITQETMNGLIYYKKKPLQWWK